MNRRIPSTSYSLIIRTAAEIMGGIILMSALVWMIITPDSLPLDAEYQSQ